MPNYRRKKEFYAGYLAKYMFLKKCRSQNLDPTIEFFKHAGILYNPANNEMYETNSEGTSESETEDES